jgi:hypothetical protein
MFIATLWILQAVIMHRNIHQDIIRPHHNKMDITHNRLIMDIIIPILAPRHLTKHMLFLAPLDTYQHHSNNTVVVDGKYLNF